MNVVNFRSVFSFTVLLGLALVGCNGGASVTAPSTFVATAGPTASPTANGSTAPTSATPTAAGSASAAPTSKPTASTSPTVGATTAPTPTAAPSPTSTSTATTSKTCVAGPNPTVNTITRNPVKLQQYNVDPSKVFVSGISSGGFFAVQMHVSHSKVFKGAAIYAAGVEYCAQGSVGLALVDCGGETNVNCQALYQNELSQSENYIDTQSAAGAIDPKSNIVGQPVYIWSGTNDQVVNPQAVTDLSSEYQHLGANVTYENTYPANHGWESPNGEVPCPSATEPYVVTCPGADGKPYDSVKTWLTKFVGPLSPRNNGTLTGSLINFDQTEFGASAANAMDTNGWVYVPQSCASGAKCGFVLAFHGCIQNQVLIGTKFITESGLDEWADTNNLIVMYPYVIQSSSPTAYNPMGCWDWWGIVDSNYAVKAGTQVTAVYKMVQRATGITTP